MLRSAGLYGANASGKSNLLTAIRALDYLVNKSATFKDGVQIDCYEPFKLSEENKHAPVSFEIEFFAPDNIRYNYQVSFEKYRILKEKLVTYTSSQPAVLYNRQPSDTWETIRFGTTFKGGRKRFGFHPFNTYLSIAGDSPEAPESIRSVFSFFQKHLFCVTHELPPFLSSWSENETLVHFAGVLLSAADTGIVDIGVKEGDPSKIKIPLDLPEGLVKKIRRDLKWQIVCSHRTSDNQTADLELKEESAGTNRLLRLAPIIAETFASGGVVVLDELENRMHPYLAEVIIRLFIVL